ncbi:MAG: hypothetical protein NTW19_11710 [Planctomycetota bacterium]|nr:hypothetical protein [Planctomycetota bacterium]
MNDETLKTEFDAALANARAGHLAARYPGDLASDVEPIRLDRERRRRRRLFVGIGLGVAAVGTVAAGLALVAVLLAAQFAGHVVGQIAARQSGKSEATPRVSLALPAAMPSFALPTGLSVLPSGESIGSPTSGLPGVPSLSLPSVSLTIEFHPQPSSENAS